MGQIELLVFDNSTWNHCHKYDIKLHLMVRLQPRSLKNFRETFITNTLKSSVTGIVIVSLNYK